ncbi:MAG: hypothetical protein II061_01035, partial [Bacteroidaceae bacterium]|nr:hypothetical protein [Bacteroidaceae bacterium]
MSKKYAICFSLLLVAGVARSQTRNQLFLSAVEKENIQHHSILCDTTDHRFCLVAISPDEKALFDTNSVEKTFQLNDSLSETVTVHFTSLPIIHIQSENISTEFSNGHFLFYDP